MPAKTKYVTDWSDVPVLIDVALASRILGKGSVMFQCEDCGKIFEEPARLPDFADEYWGAPFTKYYNGCPYCKSEEFEEVDDDL